MRRRSFLALLGLAPSAPGLLERALVASPEPLAGPGAASWSAWTAGRSGLYGVVGWNGSRFVAVGDGPAAVSGDGITWGVGHA